MTPTTEAHVTTVTRLYDTDRAVVPRWAPQAALAAILLLSAVLYGWALGSLGWGNSYYSAAVKSMGQSWTNFLFGSFDPAGVITVDKPPAALWPQVISSKIFGMHGWALLLPQVVEGVAAVFVLHRTVRRWAGEGTALLAALVMTLTPITVAINRDNNPDTLLVLFLVSAAYALTRALQSQPDRRGTWWLCACGFLIGCGFLTKMMVAWMVLPALVAAWLVGATGSWLARIGRLSIAGAVCAVSSLWWVAMVAWWPGERPYIGGSTDGGAWDLVTGYNGLGRIFGESDSLGGAGGMGGSGGMGGAFGGESGLLRLFNEQVAGQISWLLPASGVALAVAVLRRRGKSSAGRALAGSGWVLWGTWLVVCGLVYSTQEGTFHPYYTTQLAPAVAALTAGLVTGLTRAHRAGACWALPVGAGTVLVTVVWAAVVIRREPSWHGWLAWAVLMVGLLAVGLLIAAVWTVRLVPVALGGAVLAILLAPGAWAMTVPGGSASAMRGTNPTAGPTTMSFGGGGSLPGGGNSGGAGGGFQLPGGVQLPQGMQTPGGSDGGGAGAPGGMGGLGGGTALTSDQRKILDYATEHSKGARMTLAVEGGANGAASFILDSDATVIGMGGFIGSDNAPSVQQLEEWTKNGELRYVLGSESGSTGAMMGGTNGAASKRSDWVGQNCTKVPAEEYGVSTTGSDDDDQGSGGMMGRTGTTLYDCAAK
ncbi:ArnT family glycosyltransferase [Streptomyces spongiae]|uniref:Glycosyltransferase family 39 protein n=1 Tax=Streptomyces spongiae TaxID=565072 RepID=A0A5N8XM80_9ACTN|nr:glycosyltransferase family 39 protein [Streptomyces spongiae]MPY60551.1 glycosyltransferase family 39 protein [Streptomyces spongiae]